MMCMLNTHIEEIKANRRFSLCKTSQGRVFGIGHDFREKKLNDSRQNGIPRPLFDSKVLIEQIAVG